MPRLTTAGLALTLIVFTSAGCGGPEPALRDKVIERTLQERIAHLRPDGRRVSLTEAGPSGWTRACVVQPYTDRRAIREATGVEIRRSPWAGGDGHWGFIFIWKDKASYVVLPRAGGSDRGETLRCWEHDQHPSIVAFDDSTTAGHAFRALKIVTND
ncbi:hypothetical protein [Azospirillum sp.]|uniref:hypothetical protein n=1 Tax=Azospirillum sp. TaxID=34012 RepID=UPI002D6BEF4B|nr:hypothetical protein [Azospirillum sp.]HYD65266.1 hypothetical protein [Azospirillum sp.]